MTLEVVIDQNHIVATGVAPFPECGQLRQVAFGQSIRVPECFHLDEAGEVSAPIHIVCRLSSKGIETCTLGVRQPVRSEGQSRIEILEHLFDQALDLVTDLVRGERGPPFQTEFFHIVLLILN